MPAAPQVRKTRIRDRLFGPSPREVEATRELAEIHAAFERLHTHAENYTIDMATGERYSVAEGLQNIDLMLDARGWTNVFEYDDDRGLSLKQLKQASEQIRELVVGNPFIANAARIRVAQTVGAGIEFACRNRTGDQKIKPLPVALQNTMEETWAMRILFGNKAHAEMERAVFTDGIEFFLGRDSDHRMQRIQLHEITGLMRNPNDAEEVWAFRRTWNPDPDSSQPSQERVRWYYTEAVPQSERRRRVKTREGQDELAEMGYTIFDLSFNRQVGWALGVPDALCVVAWARLYKEFLVNGYVMSRSLARLAYKITVASTQAGQNAALTVAAPGQSGSTYIEGSGNQLTPLANAGRGYDFSSGDGLASAIAAGLGVSRTALLASAGSASGSNAAEQALDPIARATAAVRRKEWEDDFVRIFRYLGLRQKLVVTWNDLREDTIARRMQAWRLAEQMEIFDGQVLHDGVASELNIADPGALPSGWKQPSERKAASSSTFGQDGQAAANGRGTDDGSGASADDHDDDET